MLGMGGDAGRQRSSPLARCSRSTGKGRTAIAWPSRTRRSISDSELQELMPSNSTLALRSHW
ncbi:hypothetical protein D3C85_1564000 [compost metagenome]